MKARLRNGKIVTGRAADVFLSIGIAEEVVEEPAREMVEKPENTKAVKPAAKPPVKRKKRRGRPAKK